MSKTYAAAVANQMLDAWETAIGASPTLKIRSGAKPAHAADASTGAVLATIALPADFMADASGGVKSKLGTWQDLAADADGAPGHYEIVASDGVTVCERGDCGLNESGADLEFDSVNWTAGQQVTIANFGLSLPI
jgi:hypothetical protein